MSEQDNSGAGLESSDAAVEAFSKLLNPVAEEATEEVTEEAVETEAEEVETESEDEAEEQPSEKVTIEVDGKTVELTPEQIAEVYKNGLRQADYSRKTMEVAEQRKAAEAEIAKASQERAEYQQKLHAYAIQLEGALNEQSQINWQDLIDNDPVEYLKQQHLYNQRQAALVQAQNEQGRLAQLQEQEQRQRYTEYLNAQKQELLANLPAWKDESKAAAEKAEMRQFLVSQGFTEQDVAEVVDYRHVLLIRDAMQFRKLLKDAPAAAKKVTQAPVKAERTGVSSIGNDKNRDAVKAFKKTGRESDAIEAFKSLI
jgi:hypothetical protein